MLPETKLEDAVAFAEKLRSIVETTPINTQAGPLHLTISLGVASVPHSLVHSAKELVVTADKALYRAKRSGRNHVAAERRRDGLERDRQPSFCQGRLRGFPKMQSELQRWRELLGAATS